VADLVRRPDGELLYVPPAGEEGVTLRVLGVVLRHNDRVAQHSSYSIILVSLSFIQNVMELVVDIQ
jgi:hypothetical protein